jgi:hypothetical protein
MARQAGGLMLKKMFKNFKKSLKKIKKKMKKIWERFL